MVSPNTPVIIGVGESSERPGDPGYEGLSPVEIAGKAALAALADTGKPGLAKDIDTIATTRQFENSGPRFTAPFGKSNNFPRSVAKRIDANPKRAVLEIVGGQSPQHLINEFAAEIAAGKAELVLLAGSEAISSARHLSANGEKRDWAETIDGQLEDRGYGLKGLMSAHFIMHGLFGAPPTYALYENARRGRLGLSRGDYAKRQMGAVFAPFTEIASKNPHAASRNVYSAEELVTPAERNRMIADPYPQRLVSRDQVNQGAAVILTSVTKARALGIDEKKWVYLHGYADLKENDVLERADLSVSPAAVEASKAALGAAGITEKDVSFFDLYSCFPIAVLNIVDGLGLEAGDPRGFTTTGGLPYFGGAGNNYSMHGVASMVARLRAKPGAYGFVGANGGSLSKYSVGIFSTTPREFTVCDSKPLQKALDAVPKPAVAYTPEGWGKVETYTILYDKGQPKSGVVVGRLEADNRRFIAATPEGDPEPLERMLKEDPLGQRIYVQSERAGNRFAFSDKALKKLYPAAPAFLRDTYEFVKVERRGHLLEVTLNRPEVRNCLHGPAHEELDQIFNSFQADSDLWVAIITGAGDESFCAGADLKNTQAGRLPKSGFAGLTARLDRTKPVIAAVNGFAMGGGMETCLASDLVVADATAQFALSEVRVGVVAGAGGLIRLPRQIPKKLALELILTGRKIDAERAHALGLVNKVVPKGQALDAARALAEEILQVSPTSVKYSLQIINDTSHMASENEASAYWHKAFDELMSNEDVMEGIAAFAEKRKPEWKNR